MIYDCCHVIPYFVEHLVGIFDELGKVKVIVLCTLDVTKQP
jgi:hypothetical protein